MWTRARLFRLLGVFAAFALVLAGCDEGAQPESGEPTPTGEETGETTPAGETTSPAVGEDTRTETEVAAEPTGEPIRLGFFAPLTGPAAADGESALRGAQLAVQIVNEDGGVDGRPLELVDYDDNFSPDEAANVTRRLIEQDQVAGVISGSYSFTTRAAAPIAQQAGVPFMASYAVHPSITQVGEYAWRIGAMAEVQGRVGGNLVVNELDAQRVAVLIIDNDFGASLAEAFTARATELGAEIVFEERYPLGETDFRALLPDIQDANPDAVYAIGYFNEAASFVSQAAEAGLEAQIVGQEGYDSPTFLELAGEAANEVIITTDLNRDSDRESVQQFLTRFEEEYGEPADMVGASCFDAVRVLAQAIEASGGTEPQAILDGLRGLEDFDEAVTGPILRYTDGREVVRPLEAQIVEDLEFHHYATFEDSELITPPQ